MTFLAIIYCFLLLTHFLYGNYNLLKCAFFIVFYDFYAIIQELVNKRRFCVYLMVFGVVLSLTIAATVTKIK